MQLDALDTFAELLEVSTQRNTTAKDANEVVNYMFAGLSTLSFIFMTTILFIMHGRNQKILGTQLGIGVLFFAGLVTVVADLSLGVGKFRNIYVMVIITGFGTIVNIYGSIVLFKSPAENQNSLGFTTSTVSVIIFSITVPLALMEMLAAISAVKSGHGWRASEWFAAMFQKGIQVFIFHFSIRHKVPQNIFGASWYLKIISLFNFSMWTISIVDGDKEMLRYINELIGGNGSVVSAVYAALVIDYRLLCCFLFAELAIQVDNWDSNQHPTNVNHTITTNGNQTTRVSAQRVNFRVTSSQYTGAGYMVGLAVVISQSLNALLYVRKGETAVGPWVAVFGIIADVFFIVQGMVLVKLINGLDDKEEEEEQNSKAVDIVVGLMGVCGLSFWILRFTLAVLAERSPSQTAAAHEYFQWISVKNFIRIIGVAFQFFFFYRIGPLVGHKERISTSKIPYFLLPCIMLCQLSVFINSVIDSYSSFLGKFLEHANLGLTSSAVHRIGEPLHLGFCLHMFFHFLNINNNLNVGATMQKKISGKGADDHVVETLVPSDIEPLLPMDDERLQRADDILEEDPQQTSIQVQVNRNIDLSQSAALT